MNIDFGTAVVKTLCAVSAATVLGGATMVVTSARSNAVQDRTITTLERDQITLGEAVKDLNNTVRALDKNVAVLNERLK